VSGQAPSHAPTEDEAAALEVARAFFADLDDKWVGGPVLEWTRLRGHTQWADRFERRHTVESAELHESSPDRVVVDVRAGVLFTAARTSTQPQARFDGPAVLEKLDDEWRVVDFTIDGRRRSESLVFGPLAEQENGDVVIRILGADREAQATELVLDVVNNSPSPVRLDAAWILFGGTWDPVARARAEDPIAPHETRSLLLHAGTPLELSQQALPVAVRVRAGRRTLPFVLHVPLVRPDTAFRQSPPRRLPLLRASHRSALALYAVIAAALAWWAGWVAVAVPILVALFYWRAWRASGRLGERAYRLRFLLDAAIVGGCFAFLWLTPAVVLAVPFLVLVAVYVVLLPFRRVRADARAAIAVSAALSWLFLLGISSGALPPCRLADGPPGARADAFARAILAGDFERAHRFDTADLRPAERIVARAVRARGRPTIVPKGRDISGTQFCKAVRSFTGVDRCYAYGAGVSKVRPGVMWVGVTCHLRAWRVNFIA
jgi:hypothetical protein